MQHFGEKLIQEGSNREKEKWLKQGWQPGDLYQHFLQ